MEVGVPELLIILVLVILLFGVGRISKIAGELGSGVRAFREGLQGSDSEDKQIAVTAPAKEITEAKEAPAAKVETAGTETEELASVDHRS